MEKLSNENPTLASIKEAEALEPDAELRALAFEIKKSTHRLSGAQPTPQTIARSPIVIAEVQRSNLVVNPSKPLLALIARKSPAQVSDKSTLSIPATSAR